MGQGVGKQQSFSPLGAPPTLPAPPYVQQPRSSPKLYPIEFLWRLHFIGMIDLIIDDWWLSKSPAPLVSKGLGLEPEVSAALLHDWFSSSQPHTCHISLQKTRTTSESQFSEPCSRKWGQRPIIDLLLKVTISQAVSLKTKHSLTIQLSSFTVGHLSQRNKNIFNTEMSIVLFTVPQIGRKVLKCPSAGEQWNKLRIHVIEYYLAVNKSKLWTCGATWSQGIVLNEKP